MSEKYHFSIDLPVGAVEAYRAFTEEQLLTRWLSEFARVSIAGGVYELSGKYLPGAPHDAITKLVSAEKDAALSFRMLIREVDTLVAVKFSEAGVTIEQDKVPRKDGEVAVEDFWGIALENLRRLMTGGTGPLLRDFSSRPKGSLSVSTEIKGPHEQVFCALIDPVQLDKYVAARAVVDPVVGGKIDFGWGGGPIKILSVEPNRELSYSWQYGDDPETVVMWTLEGSDSGTRLTLVHSGFGADRPADDYSTGWYFFVNSLKSMIETGPAWRRANVHASGA